MRHLYKILAVLLIVGLTLYTTTSTKVVRASSGTKTIFLTTTGVNQSWVVPADFNINNNIIECIGAGGDGGTAVLNVSSGGGGGAGLYALITNLNISGTVTYSVGLAATTTNGNNA